MSGPVRGAASARETIDAMQAHHTDLVAADREDEAATVTESLELLADPEATSPPIDAVYSTLENNEP